MPLICYPVLCPLEFLRIANSLVDTAGEVIRRYFRMPVAVDVKLDDSPVTAADRWAEAAIRENLSSLMPVDGVIGEEFGGENADVEFVCAVGPIDGTRPFIAGRPRHLDRGALQRRPRSLRLRSTGRWRTLHRRQRPAQQRADLDAGLRKAGRRIARHGIAASLRVWSSVFAGSRIAPGMRSTAAIATITACWRPIMSTLS